MRSCDSLMVRLDRLRSAVTLAAGAALLLILGAVLVLIAHPVTGPEIRSYLRDRFLRPWARLPRSPERGSAAGTADREGQRVD